jgi:hypothetical protein
MKISLKIFGLLSTFACFAGVNQALAMDLDWSGQFRSEAALINNYAPETYSGTSTAAQGSYEVDAAGSKNSRFQTLFMRLQPKLIVNDNVSIKSEWWLGNPVTGFYGSDYPGTSRSDQRNYNSTYSGGATITAQRFWAEFLTDFGTVQVGRAPQNWGLGIVHNSGDGLFDRYQSTGDTIGMISKFGNFTVSPSAVKYDMGNAVGGTCVGGSGCSHPTGGATMSEYSMGLKYENPDEDFEGGVQLTRRIAGAQSESDWINYNGGTPAVDATTVPASTGPGRGGMNITVWDIYAKKRMGKFSFGVEAPIYNGDLIGYQYKAFALALEAKYRASDSWSFQAKAGKVPGQPNSPNANANGVGQPQEKWSMVYFHPNYRLGLLMFNYNFANFAGNNNQNNTTTGSTRSIYDNPITNANYLMLGTTLSADKWQFTGTFVTARANETASTGQNYFNTLNRAYSSKPADHGQSKSLGTEFDLGAAFNWDEFTTFAIDFGLLMQGDFYRFSGTGPDQDLKTVFGAVGSVGIKF